MADTKRVDTAGGITARQVQAAVESMIRDAAAAQARAERLRAASAAATRQRDALVRQAASMNVQRRELARRIGLSRAQLYVVIDGDGEEDEAAIEMAWQAESEARRRWEAAGSVGEVDDFWPLD